jgi:hypothetical protein
MKLGMLPVLEVTDITAWTIEDEVHTAASTKHITTAEMLAERILFWRREGDRVTNSKRDLPRARFFFFWLAVVSNVTWSTLSPNVMLYYTNISSYRVPQVTAVFFLLQKPSKTFWARKATVSPAKQTNAKEPP